MISKQRRMWAVITGGSSGVGAILSAHLIARYNLLWIYGSNHAKAEDERKRILSDAPPGTRIELIAQDLADLSGLGSLAARISELVGADGLRLLIHCAGQGQFDLLLASKNADIERLVNLNLTAPILLTKLVLKEARMRGTDALDILVFGSTVAAKPLRGTTVYAATKNALEAFVRTFALELEDTHSQISALRLGPVDTPMLRTNLKTLPRKFVKPEKIVSAVESLLTGKHNGLILDLDVEA